MSLNAALLLSFVLAASDPVSPRPASQTGTDSDESSIARAVKAVSRLFPTVEIELLPTDDHAVTVACNVDISGAVDRIVQLGWQFYPALVEALRTDGPQQVQIQMMIAEVSHNKLRECGFETLNGGSNPCFASLIGSLLAPGRISPTCRAPLISSPDTLARGKITNGQVFHELLHAMKEQGIVTVRSEPTIVTCSGRRAEVHIGGQFPISVADQQGNVITQFREYGTKVELVPVVVGSSRVRLELQTDMSERDEQSGLKFAGVFGPGLETRYINTSVELSSGETYVIAGLFTKSEAPFDQKAAEGEFDPPAEVFSSAKEAQEEKELVILVTPTLVAPLKYSSQACASSCAPSTAELQDPAKHWDFVIPATAEIDADEPHPSAARCCRGRPCPSICPAEGVAEPCECEKDWREANEKDWRELDVAGESEVPAILKVPVSDAVKLMPVCRDQCCKQATAGEKSSPSCCGCNAKQVNPKLRTIGNDDDGECQIVNVYDIQAELQVVQQRSRLLRTRNDVTRIQVVSSQIANVVQFSPRELSILGQGLGATDITFWFDDATQEPLTLLVRVVPDPEQEGRGEPQCCQHALVGSKSGDSQAACTAKHSNEESPKLHNDEEECDDPCCPEAVLAAHMPELMEMVQVRLQWEAAIMHARTTAELARQEARHSEEMREIQTKHLTELQKAREAMWETERKALDGQHRQAMKHEQELADLRIEQLRKTYESRLATMETESVRKWPERGSHSKSESARYDNLAPAEFSRPSPSISAAQHNEVELLRREVRRLHALVEDLLCVTPETPPVPVPQSDPDDGDE